MRFSTIVIIVKQNIKIWLYKLFGIRKRLLPYKLLINLTNNCNSRCEYCDIWKINKDEPSLRQQEINLSHITKLFSDLNKSLLWLSFSGGEVTVLSEFESIIKAANQYCPRLRVMAFTTNALRVQRTLKYAKLIQSYGYDALVTISLDGDKALHDKVRGVDGNYDKCVELYHLLRENGIQANFGLTVSDQNHDFIMNQYHAYRKSMKAVTFVHSKGIYAKDNAVDYGTIRKALLHIYRSYHIDSLAEIIEKIHIKISLFFIDHGLNKDIVPCEVINTSLHIMPYGDVQPCMYLPSAGNIKDASILDICRSEKMNHLRKRVKKGQCPHCWMNCYSPHSIMQHPIKSLFHLMRKVNHD